MNPNSCQRRQWNWARFFVIGLLAVLPLGPRQGVLAQADAGPLKIPILAYHYISPETPPDNPNDGGYASYFVTPEQFNAQLDVIQAKGYTTIGLDDLWNYRDHLEPLPAKPVIITFDDGEQGIYTYAFPALQERDMRATFFIITDTVKENDAERCTDFNWDGMPMCTVIWSEVSEMHANGMEIGAHTRTHPGNLINLMQDPNPDPYSASEEISGSKQAIEDHLGSGAARFFAYPHGIGSGDAVIEGLVQNAGFQAAVGYANNGCVETSPDGNCDGIADPLADELYALPRLAVYREHSLKLNPQDPWYFFMNRLDPDYLLPNVLLQVVQVTDSAGYARNQFYPGEALNLAAQTDNNGDAADVTARLQFANSQGVTYDSHLTNPAADQSITPFPAGGEHRFEYAWQVPSSADSTGLYPYQLTATDLTGLLEYYQFNSTVKNTPPAFEVIPKPISVSVTPSKLPSLAGQTVTLTFTVRVDPGESADETYLSVSLSDHLDVIDSTTPQGNWTRYSPGYQICKKDGSCVEAPYLLYEMYAAEKSSGSRSYTLTVQGLPGVSAQDWVKYRLSMDMTRPALTDQADRFLRDPLQGELDQQDYFAYRLNGADALRIYLPVINR